MYDQLKLHLETYQWALADQKLEPDEIVLEKLIVQLKKLEQELNQKHKNYYTARIRWMNLQSLPDTDKTKDKQIQDIEAELKKFNNNQYAIAIENEIINILLQVTAIRRLDERDKVSYISIKTIRKYDNFYDPIFQFLISTYGLLKNILPTLRDFSDKALSYFSFSLGDILNFIPLYGYYRDRKVPQFKMRLGHTLLSIAAAVTNIMLIYFHVHPYALAITALAIVLSSLSKDSYRTHQSRAAVQKEKEIIENLRKRLSDLSAPEIIMTPELQVELACLPDKITYHIKNLEKLRDMRFENKRAVFFDVLNTIFNMILLLGALGLSTALWPAPIVVLPPEMIAFLTKWTVIVASIYTTTSFLDVIDQLANTLVTRTIADVILKPIEDWVLIPLVNFIAQCCCWKQPPLATSPRRPSIQGMGTPGLFNKLDVDRNAVSSARESVQNGNVVHTASTHSIQHVQPIATHGKEGQPPVTSSPRRGLVPSGPAVRL